MSSDALHIALALSPFLVLPVISWRGSSAIGGTRLLAILPGLLATYFTYTAFLVYSSGPFTVSVSWAPALNLSLAFRYDGLSTLFAILITVIGTLIVAYARTYLADHPHAGRLNITLFAFMGSMLGLVLSDNVIALFVFWELTGFTSYLLIGFEHRAA